jgi:hypothetical protein
MRTNVNISDDFDNDLEVYVEYELMDDPGDDMTPPYRFIRLQHANVEAINESYCDKYVCPDKYDDKILNELYKIHNM